MSLDILYSDDTMIAVNKPHFMLSVPGKNPDDGQSVVERLTPEYPDIRAVHRLDYATSGVLLLALGRENLRALSKQFENRQVEKRYIARVYGRIAADDGVINEPLICDWERRPLQKICYEHGKPSETRWRVLARDKGSSVLELTPITGRSHQLRVHCAHITHPIIGDPFYAHPKAKAMSDRLELYATDLHIHHPTTGATLHLSAPHKYG